MAEKKSKKPRRGDAGEPPLAKLEAALVDAAEAAGKILMKHFGATLKVQEKLGAGLVTNVDIASEQAVMRLLRKARPDFGFLTEESPPENKGALGRWIIDPLDGTTNYVHRFPMFCVSLAAEWDGKIVAGVVHHPVLKDMYVATLGGGSTVNGKKIRVSRTSKLSDSLLTTGFTYSKESHLQAEMKAFHRLSEIARAVRRPGSAALDLAYTARGVFDGFWERSLSPWDVAAGSLLVQEAGGKVTDFQGKPFKVDGGAIMASNSHLHAPLLQTVAPEICPI